MHRTFKVFCSLTTARANRHGNHLYGFNVTALEGLGFSPRGGYPLPLRNKILDNLASLECPVPVYMILKTSCMVAYEKLELENSLLPLSGSSVDLILIPMELDLEHFVFGEKTMLLIKLMPY